MGVPSDLLTRALELPVPDRVELANDLFESLEPGGLEQDAGYEESWNAEIEARSRALAEGRTSLLSRDEVESRMRQAVAEARDSRSIRASRAS